jgi:hypothetical protein
LQAAVSPRGEIPTQLVWLPQLHSQLSNIEPKTSR